MDVTGLFGNRSLSVANYRCTATPSDRPFTERHSAFTLSWVRKGTFGCRARGKSFELVPGSLLVGFPGDEYMCTHEHHACGDECLSFSFSAELWDTVEGDREVWHSAALPPLAELAPIAGLALAAAEGRSDVAFEEIGALLVGRFLELATQGRRSATPARPGARRRVVDAALRITACSHETLSLDTMAAWAGMSSFHFVRVFARVLGLTPHQYLIRCRLAQAARTLAARELPVTAIAFEVGFDDLSHFIRTFRAAVGVSPGKFREMRGGSPLKPPLMI
jgi:AraC-like DNA-binding protein